MRTLLIPAFLCLFSLGLHLVYITLYYLGPIQALIEGQGAVGRNQSPNAVLQVPSEQPRLMILIADNKRNQSDNVREVLLILRHSAVAPLEPLKLSV